MQPIGWRPAGNRKQPLKLCTNTKNFCPATFRETWGVIKLLIYDDFLSLILVQLLNKKGALTKFLPSYLNDTKSANGPKM